MSAIFIGHIKKIAISELFTAFVRPPREDGEVAVEEEEDGAGCANIMYARLCANYIGHVFQFGP